MDRRNSFKKSKELDAYPLISSKEQIPGDDELSGTAPLQNNHPPAPGFNIPLPTVIINQPGGKEGFANTEWMSPPQNVINCPPGLEYLTLIDQLFVHQKLELLEVFTGFETKNQYTIQNCLGQKIFYAGEDSDCCSRNCFGSLRAFEMKILDNSGNYIMNLHRPLACASCCCPCCLQSIEVSAPPGTVIGTVEQKWSIFYPQFVIKDPSGEVILHIEGPFCTSSCCCKDVEFKVLSANRKIQVGKISKQWSGLANEIFTDADNYGITFPMNLDVRMKATMLGACFLIEMMFFEGAPTNDRLAE